MRGKEGRSEEEKRKGKTRRGKRMHMDAPLLWICLKNSAYFISLRDILYVLFRSNDYLKVTEKCPQSVCLHTVIIQSIQETLSWSLIVKFGDNNILLTVPHYCIDARMQSS
jgi:hypothetical protein